MNHDGKFLENFVRQVEESLAGQAVKVENNVRKYDEAGIQLAEFDLIVTGKVGSTDLRVLIECRDRPTQGPAPGAWIEQMVGRRQIHHFSHVIAVSTTGFSSGAKQAAVQANIELREVASFNPDEFGSWVGAGVTFKMRELKLDRLDALIEPRAQTPHAVNVALRKLLSSKKRGQLLITPRGGPKFSVTEFWNAYSPKQLRDRVLDDSGPITITIDLVTEGLDVRILTTKGLVFIDRITFTAYLQWVEETLLPVGVRYLRTNSSEPIGELVKYTLPAGDESFSIEIRQTFPT